MDRRLVVSSPEELTPESIKSVDPKEHPAVVPAIIEKVDHVIKACSTPDNAHEVYVYGVPGTEAFAKFHEAALALAEKDESVTYVVRYSWDKNGNGITGALAGEQNTPLQGYGVEFSLKSVEYKTIDERGTEGNNNNNNNNEDKKEQNENNEDDDSSSSGIEKSNEFDKMDSEKIRMLGVRAGHHIMNAQNPLAAMRELTEDFPAYAVNLDRDGNKETPDSEINLRMNAENAGSESRLLINGRTIETPNDNAFSIVSIITEEEMAKALKLHELGISDYESVLALLEKPIPDSGDEMYRYNVSDPARTSCT